MRREGEKEASARPDKLRLPLQTRNYSSTMEKARMKDFSLAAIRASFERKTLLFFYALFSLLYHVVCWMAGFIQVPIFYLSLLCLRLPPLFFMLSLLIRLLLVKEEVLSNAKNTPIQLHLKRAVLIGGCVGEGSGEKQSLHDSWVVGTTNEERGRLGGGRGKQSTE